METGKKRVIDELGRIVLPAEFRRVLQLEEKSSVLVTLEGDALVIRKATDGESADPAHN